MVMVFLGTGYFHHWHNTAYLFMAVSLAYITWLCQWTLDNNYSRGAKAAAAGAIILAIVEFIWAFELSAPGGTWLSSGDFSRHGGGGNGGGYGNNHNYGNYGNYGNSRFGGNNNSVRPAMSNTGGDNNNHLFNNKKRDAPLPRKNNYRGDEESDIASSNAGATTSQNVEKATALHTYQANPEDPNEISFNKDEVLDILDKRGNWWHARKQDGTTGIVPSNYF
ncbi:MAG: hypothetical protein EXX96DRAFT_576339 [Benjaminiella poitrasii]|nr:MAG: hypothetical protein EXX96DRAFT_576339 [Benjaminiella poitrasii]